jgi:murein DD-endopeptidase MepM/ murein hydrolase activator NlpD
MIGCLAGAAAAEPPRLEIPIDCALGQDCFVQNYFDVDPGSGASDHACGPLANDGHKGTDFRVRDLTDVERGVVVLAAATGRVASLRDGVADGFPDELGTPGSPGRECGNGVVLDHGGGWRTQYCHLRQGSVGVAPGDAVEAGAPLGLVGMSGLAEFPHLHLTVWHGERAIDPFLGPQQGVGAEAGCRGPHQPLWRDEAMRRLAYQASGVLNAGFASRAPSLRGIERGGYGEHPPTTRSDLWFYVRMFGLHPGDRQRLRVFDPAGRLVMEWTSAPAASTETLWLQPIGRQAPADGWPAGRYRGEFILIRKGAVVLESVAEAEIR